MSTLYDPLLKGNVLVTAVRQVTSNIRSLIYSDLHRDPLLRGIATTGKAMAAGCCNDSNACVTQLPRPENTIANGASWVISPAAGASPTIK
jgi:hypothetical protein